MGQPDGSILRPQIKNPNTKTSVLAALIILLLPGISLLHPMTSNTFQYGLKDTGNPLIANRSIFSYQSVINITMIWKVNCR